MKYNGMRKHEGGVKVLIYATNLRLPRHTFKEKPKHSNTHN